VDEAILIEQAKRGDSIALASLLQANYPMVVKYLTKITFDPHFAEDLAQETMIKCIHKIGLYNGKSKFSSWLITMATRLHIDEWRKRKREKEWQASEANIRKIQWQAAAMDEQWSETLDIIGKLPQEVRTAIVLKHYHGFSLEEIAEMMGVPVGTVKSRIHNGIKAARKERGNDAETG